MGKVGRIFCIAIPMALSIIALVFLILTGLAQTNSESTYLSNLYFLRANITEARDDLARISEPGPDTDSAAIRDGNIQILNYYTVGLWNYCAGNGENADLGTDIDVTPGQDGAYSVVYCTGRDVTFAFDPRAAWGIDETVDNDFFDSDLNNALNRYRNFVSRAIGPLYIVTVASAGVTILVSIGAAFSRIGSVCTSVACGFTTGISFVFAVAATAAYAILAGAFNAALHSRGIDFDLGPAILVYIWLAFVASFVAGLFWALSSCCCSGKSRSKNSRHKGKGKGEYQNLMGGNEQGYPMHTGGWSGQGAQPYAVGHQRAGGAYEPFRHQAR